MLSYPDKLVNGTHAAKNGIVFNDHMSGNLGIITHHAVIAYNTVMSQMTIGLDQTIASYGSFFPVFGTAVYRYEFANGRIVSDEYIGIFSLEFQILRNGCD